MSNILSYYETTSKNNTKNIAHRHTLTQDYHYCVIYSTDMVDLQVV